MTCECAHTSTNLTAAPVACRQQTPYLPIAGLLRSNSEHFPHRLLICVLLEVVREVGIGFFPTLGLKDVTLDRLWN